MITIVDYGLGNIKAFTNMYKRLNIQTKISSTVSDLEGASHIILPGVGAFDHAMGLLEASGMRSRLDEMVMVEHIPVLGVCVGMQILASSSDEGVATGLGWVEGKVREFAANSESKNLPLPHMGWNDVNSILDMRLFKGLEKDARFYFLHSYYFECHDTMDIMAKANYGFDFHAAVHRNNVYGVQFHPEKSHHWGAALLKNFAEV